jgi:hypothetical protein
LEVLLLIPTSLGLVVYTLLAPPNLVHGDYLVEETNPFVCPLDISDYFNSNDLDRSDKNTAVDNSIGVELCSGEENTENNFVDINAAKISGTVKEDDQNSLVSVLSTLKLLCGNSTIATTSTGSDGSYLSLADCNMVAIPSSAMPSKQLMPCHLSS